MFSSFLFRSLAAMCKPFEPHGRLPLQLPFHFLPTAPPPAHPIPGVSCGTFLSSAEGIQRLNWVKPLA